jgi:hypothetical protein
MYRARKRAGGYGLGAGRRAYNGGTRRLSERRAGPFNNRDTRDKETAMNGRQGRRGVERF